MLSVGQVDLIPVQIQLRNYVVVVSFADVSSASASTLASAFSVFHGSLTNAGPPLYAGSVAAEVGI